MTAGHEMDRMESNASRQSMDSDHTHILPLSYTPTTPGRRSEESGSSSTEVEEVDALLLDTTKKSKGCRGHEKRWSVPWTMWGNTDEKCHGDGGEMMSEKEMMIREEESA